MYHQTAVLWVHASNETRFREGFARIADLYKIEGREDPRADVAVVRAFLERNRSCRWVMIIDNADDRELFSPSHKNDAAEQNSPDLKRYFPQCDHGSILLTTRDQKTASDFMFGTAALAVDKISDQDALELVHRTLRHKETTPEDASKLSAKLEHLPLALSQALAYIYKNSISIKEYIELLDDKTLISLLSEEFEAKGRPTDTPNAVTAAWIISFEQIERTDALAANFLSIMSFFDRQNIPLTLIIDVQKARAPGKEQETRLRAESLGTLIAYSFITKTTEGSYAMHRLVQVVTRNWLAKRKLERITRAWATTILLHAWPAVNWNTLNEARELLPHMIATMVDTKLKNCPSRQEKLVQGRVLFNLAHFYLYTSQYDHAALCGEQAHQLWQETAGSNDSQTLEASLLRLRSYEGLERSDNKTIQFGEEERNRSLAAYGLGKDHSTTLQLTQALSAIYRQRREFGRAEILLKQVVEARNRIWGSEHGETLKAMTELGAIYGSQEQPDSLNKGEKILLEVTSIMRNSPKVMDMERLNTLQYLAIVYMKQKRPIEADEILTQVVTKRKEVLGTEHKATLTSMSELAEISYKRGDFIKALELRAEVLKIRRRIVGEDHLRTLRCWYNYALVLKKLGQTREAVDEMRACLSRQTAILGPEHLETVLTQTKLGVWERKLDGRK